MNINMNKVKKKTKLNSVAIWEKSFPDKRRCRYKVTEETACATHMRNSKEYRMRGVRRKASGKYIKKQRQIM